MYLGGTSEIPYSPSYQPRLYAPPPLTPQAYTSSQFTQLQNRVHYSPHTPRMDNYPNPPSPDSPYIPSSPTISYPPASTSTIRPQPPAMPTYMSPHLAQQFERMSTTSPMIGTLPSLPDMYAHPAHPAHPAPPAQHPLSNPPPYEHQSVILHDLFPREGTQGTPLTIACDIDFSAAPSPTSSDSSDSGSSLQAVRVVFGVHPVQTSVHVVDPRGKTGAGQYCKLTVTVPSWTSTGMSGRTNKVPVYVQLLSSRNHSILETIPVGEYKYTAISTRSTSYTISQGSLKRSGEALESGRPSPNTFLHRRVLSGGPKMESPEVSSYAQLPVTYQTSLDPDQGGSTYSSPYLGTTSLPNVSAQAPYSPPSQPNLMRATQVYAPTVMPSTYVPQTTGKAQLELTGDITSMAKGWTPEEWNARRRLVQFWRRQDGTTIYAAFRPLSQQDYPHSQNSIIISCIFREDKNSCFVTSVDAIYLLEALVGTRFTVEEKNRIRRNLEGFRPITVSKNKPGSEEFFKVIMGFPNPKPRNIEKDVKVFPWDILGAALKKILGKYSAAGHHPSSSSMGPPMDSPTMYAQPHMPAPIPLQSRDSYHGSSSSSAPHLTSHASSDSSVYAQSSSYQPQTPQMSHSNSHLSDSPRYLSHNHSQQSYASHESRHGHMTHSHSHSQHDTPQGIKRDPFDDLPGTNQYDHHQGGYWAGEHGSHTHDYNDVGALGYVGGGDGSLEEGQFPHVHESAPKSRSSNDLRVVYPGMTTHQGHGQGLEEEEEEEDDD